MRPLGQVIKTLRYTRDFSSGDLAKAAHISKPLLSLIESGKRHPSLDVVKRLAIALDVPPEALILLTVSELATFSPQDAKDNKTMKIIRSVHLLLEAQDNLRKELSTLDKPVCTTPHSKNDA